MILSVNQLKYGHCVQVETFDFLSLETSNGKTRQFVSLYERNRSSSLYLKNDVHNVTVKCKDCKKLQRKLKLEIGQNCRLLLRILGLCIIWKVIKNQGECWHVANDNWSAFFNFACILEEEKTECLPVIFCTGGGSIISFLSFLNCKRMKKRKPQKLHFSSTMKIFHCLYFNRVSLIFDHFWL